jgi:hypothetical protein
MEHWSTDFEHPSITDENRESFNKAASKFETPDDMAVGYMELQKTAGRPFKLPESLEKLPDDASRNDFTAQARKLLNIRTTKDIKELIDVNLKDGIAEGATYDEDFANSFKQFVVENNLNVNDMPKYAKFFNVAMAQIAAKAETDKIAAAEKCDAALIAHPDIGSKERLLVMTEQFTRAMKNNVGLTADEVEVLADGLALSKLTTNPVLARVMLKQFAPLAAEGTTESGAGEGGEKKERTIVDDEPKTAKALNWK